MHHHHYWSFLIPFLLVIIVSLSKYFRSQSDEYDRMMCHFHLNDVRRELASSGEKYDIIYLYSEMCNAVVDPFFETLSLEVEMTGNEIWVASGISRYMVSPGNKDTLLECKIGRYHNTPLDIALKTAVRLYFHEKPNHFFGDAEPSQLRGYWYDIRCPKVLKVIRVSK